MDCTVLRCIAPDSVQDEVNRNLPRVVEGFDEARRARAFELWARYRSKIEWVGSADHACGTNRFPALTARDPSDVPLAAVFCTSNADAIITDDPDLLESAEVIAIKRTALMVVRDYARAKAPAVAAITVPVAIGSTALAIVLELWAALSDPWKVLMILGGVVLMVRAYLASAAEDHATIRAALSDWTTATSSLVASAGEHEAAVIRALRSSGARNLMGQPRTSVA